MECSSAVLNILVLLEDFLLYQSPVLVVSLCEGSQCQVPRLIQPRNLNIRHCKTETWKKSNNYTGQ